MRKVGELARCSLKIGPLPGGLGKSWETQPDSQR